MLICVSHSAVQPFATNDYQENTDEFMGDGKDGKEWLVSCFKYMHGHGTGLHGTWLNKCVIRTAFLLFIVWL